jgi:hypothetical protein
VGIFDGSGLGVFTTYHARLQIRDLIMGGTPIDRKVIQSWIRTKTGLTDDSEELRQLTLQAMKDMGLVGDGSTFQEAVESSEAVAESKHGVGFRRDPGKGLFLESRCVKAMLKECANIWFASVRSQKFGAAEKQGAKNYFAEHVFITPDKIWLGVSEPTDSHLFIGHTTGPSGPQSNLTLYEYVRRPILEFDVRVVGDGIKPDDWGRVWLTAQEVGLGSLRSQGFGTFDIEEWSLVTQGDKTGKVDKPAANGKIEPPAVLVLA